MLRQHLLVILSAISHWGFEHGRSGQDFTAALLYYPSSAVNMDDQILSSRCVTNLNAIIKFTPASSKHLYNICTKLGQRRRRWADVGQIIYKYFVFAVTRPMGF